jgi:hypothetical protein
MLGLNLIILLFYYNGAEFHFERQSQFCNTIMLVVLDNVVLYYSFSFVAERFKDEAAQSSDTTPNLIEQEVEDIDLSQELADNKYQQILAPTRRILPLFLIQCGLFMLYCDNMNGKPSEVDSKQVGKVSGFYWFVAVLIQMYAGESLLGKPYNRKWWTRLMVGNETWREVLDTVLCSEPPEEFDLRFYRKQFWCFEIFNSWCDWLIRMLMDFVVNGMIRDLIKYTFPIMLCVEDPLDFVKDCTAVFFIVQLDDLQDEEEDLTINALKALLKFRIFYETKEEDKKNRITLTKDEYKALTQEEPPFMVQRITSSKRHEASYSSFMERNKAGGSEDEEGA